MKTIKYTPVPNKKPQLSEAQETRLASLSDEDIDYSDIEELNDEFWEKAEIVSPDLTQPITLRVRSPLSCWLNFKIAIVLAFESAITLTAESAILAVESAITLTTENAIAVILLIRL